MKRIFCIWLFSLLAVFVTGYSNEGIKQEPEKDDLTTETIISVDKIQSEISFSSDTETGEELPAISVIEIETDLETETPSDINQEEKETMMKIQIGDTIFMAALAENSSVDALKELLEDGSITLKMSDYANMEKGADLGVTLPQNNVPMDMQPGDIILYQGKTLAIYYDTNSWSLTPIAKIENVDANELRQVLGNGDVTVILSMER